LASRFARSSVAILRASRRRGEAELTWLQTSPKAWLVFGQRHGNFDAEWPIRSARSSAKVEIIEGIPVCELFSGQRRAARPDFAHCA